MVSRARAFGARTAAVTVVAVLAVVAVTAPAVGGPGDGSAPVREQNLDANGAIKVAQQGTTQVSGTVTLDGAAQQRLADLAAKVDQLNTQVAALTGVARNIDSSTARLAAPPPAKVVRLLLVDRDGRDEREFPPMLVSSITIEGGTDEARVWVSDFPLSSNQFPTFTFGSGDALGFRHVTFPQPVSLRSSRLFCANEFDPCQIDVTLVGTALP